MEFSIDIFTNIRHVCLFVCLCPTNVKMSKHIGPELFEEPHMTPWTNHGKLKYKEFYLKKYF